MAAESQTIKIPKKSGLSRAKRKEKQFLFCVWIYPIILFLVLYVYVNINYITMAFQKYDPLTGQYSWNGINNFIDFLKSLVSTPGLNYAMINSVAVTVLAYFILLPINIIVNFAIYKKVYLAGFFKVIFFLPSLISSIVWVLVYKYFFEYGVPAIVGAFGGNSGINLLGDPNNAFYTLMILRLWTGIGSVSLVYLGTMSRIPESLIESGKLDGMNMFQELWHITIPMIFPIVCVSLIGLVSSVFLADLGAFAYYGENAPSRLYTFNYYLFTMVVNKGGAGDPSNYTYAAAAGLLFTIIIAPLTLLVRHLLEKYGPSAEY